MATRVEKKEDQTKLSILETLKQNTDGLTISDISRILSIHYTTASKYLAILEAEGKLIHRSIGMAKVFKTTEVHNS